MAKVENPYSKVLVNVEDAMALHKIEYSRLLRNFLEIQLEQKVQTLENHPLVNEIKSQEKRSEEDQILLDTNAFSLNYQKEKLFAYKNFDRNYKKFTEITIQLKSMIKEAENKLALNSMILSKFSAQEISNDPKLKKMTTYVPNGYDAALSKFEQLDLLLSVDYANYFSKNNNDLAEKLSSFLEESKKFRTDLLSMFKQTNIDEKGEEKEEAQVQTEEPSATIKLFDDNRDEFESLKKSIKEANFVGEQELNDAKFYLNIALSGEQIAIYNKFEEELITAFGKNVSLTNKVVDFNENWMGSVNKILSNCIFDVIDAKENGSNPTSIIGKYTEKYIPEEKEDNEVDGGVSNKPQPKSTDRQAIGKKTSFVKRIMQ